MNFPLLKTLKYEISVILRLFLTKFAVSLEMVFCSEKK